MTLWDFGRANNMSTARVVDDEDHRQQVYWWVAGRIFGVYVSFRIPWRRRLS